MHNKTPAEGRTGPLIIQMNRADGPTLSPKNGRPLRPALSS